MLSVHKEAIRILLFDDLTMPVVKLEHIVALKIFAMKNDPDRALTRLSRFKKNMPIFSGLWLQSLQTSFKFCLG